MTIQDQLNTAVLEFVLKVQSLIALGWEFKDLKYGECGCPSRITAVRNGVEHELRDMNDFGNTLERFHQNWGD